MTQRDHGDLTRRRQHLVSIRVALNRSKSRPGRYATRTIVPMDISSSGQVSQERLFAATATGTSVRLVSSARKAHCGSSSRHRQLPLTVVTASICISGEVRPTTGQGVIDARICIDDQALFLGHR